MFKIKDISCVGSIDDAIDKRIGGLYLYFNLEPQVFLGLAGDIANRRIGWPVMPQGDVFELGIAHFAPSFLRTATTDECAG